VPVRSGSYEVELSRRTMQPCYWPSTCHRVLRGTWFAEKGAEWMPLREALADQLEQAYCSQVWLPAKGMVREQPDGRLAARIDLSAAVDPGLYALFYSSVDAWLVRDSSFAWLKKLGAGSAASPTRLRLRRGYQPPATPAALQKEADLEAEAVDDASATTPPTALLLVVHGIGQTLHGANIAQDAVTMRAALRTAERDAAVAEAAAAAAGVEGAVTDGHVVATAAAAASASGRGRIEVLPVQWRKTLTLEVDSLAAGLMPPGIPSLRQVLHSTAVEVLLYLTPMHRAAILSSLVTSLNSVYAKFMLRNPDFRGPVSIFAHSLGSIICWDVLCNQLPPAGGAIAPFGGSSGGGPGSPTAVPVASWNSSPVAIQQLDFEVDQFILAGSPLGCFLALRGVNQAAGRGLGTPGAAALMQCHPGIPPSPHGLPAVRRLYNLYHPYDPVAYRLEPLAYPAAALARHRPALAELAAGGKRLHIAAQQVGDSVSNAATRIGTSIANAFSFGRTKSPKAKEKRHQPLGAAPGKGTSAPPSPLKQSPPLPPGGAGGEALPISTGVEAGVEGDQTHPPAPAENAAPPTDPMDVDDAHGVPGPVFADEETGPGPEAEPPAGEASAALRALGHVAKIAGGPLSTEGGWATSGAGRLDFALQEASLESQYLAALGAHFLYWSSPDVALFVHRAVRGLDVLSGTALSGKAWAPAGADAVAAAFNEGVQAHVGQPIAVPVAAEGGVGAPLDERIAAGRQEMESSLQPAFAEG